MGGCISRIKRQPIAEAISLDDLKIKITKHEAETEEFKHAAKVYLRKGEKAKARTALQQSKEASSRVEELKANVSTITAMDMQIQGVEQSMVVAKLYSNQSAELKKLNKQASKQGLVKVVADIGDDMDDAQEFQTEISAALKTGGEPFEMDEDDLDQALRDMSDLEEVGDGDDMDIFEDLEPEEFMKHRKNPADDTAGLLSEPRPSSRRKIPMMN